ESRAAVGARDDLMPSPKLSAAARKPSARRGTAKHPTRVAAGAGERDGRERILACAITAFSELGYAGTTTAAIARNAGVTQPLIHHPFGSKDGLWRAAMDAVFAQVPRLTPPVAPGSDLREAILGIVERFIRFVALHPEVTRIIAREGATPSARLD